MRHCESETLPRVIARTSPQRPSQLDCNHQGEPIALPGALVIEGAKMISLAESQLCQQGIEVCNSLEPLLGGIWVMTEACVQNFTIPGNPSRTTADFSFSLISLEIRLLIFIKSFCILPLDGFAMNLILLQTLLLT